MARNDDPPADFASPPCFLHEIDRVFGDRLIDMSDRQWVQQQQKEHRRHADLRRPHRQNNH